jgi:hypothetical protein
MNPSAESPPATTAAFASANAALDDAVGGVLLEPGNARKPEVFQYCQNPVILFGHGNHGIVDRQQARRSGRTQFNVFIELSHVSASLP